MISCHIITSLVRALKANTYTDLISPISISYPILNEYLLINAVQLPPINPANKFDSLAPSPFDSLMIIVPSIMQSLINNNT